MHRWTGTLTGRPGVDCDSPVEAGSPDASEDRSVTLPFGTASERGPATRWAAGAVPGLLGAVLFLASCSSTEPAGAPAPAPPRAATTTASAQPAIVPARAPSGAAPLASPPPTTAAPALSPTPQPGAGSAPGGSQSLGRDDGSAVEPGAGGTKSGDARQVKGDSASTPATGTVYTWQDGDRTERVLLQADLVLQSNEENRNDDEVVTRGDTASVVRAQPRHDEADTDPVFRSPAGDLMTLPGGVLLALDAGWDQARVDRFFSDNDIDRSRVEGRDFAVNAFFVTTQPGFPSLTLANELAAQDGVLISSPNWRTEAVLR